MVDPGGSAARFDARLVAERLLERARAAPTRALVALLLSAVVGVAVGALFLVGRPTAQPEVALTRAVRITTTTAPPPPALVHVAGAVQRPGVLHLPEGARVADAVDAAGGLRDDADVDRLNLAERVADGARVYVPAKGETGSPPVVSGAGAGVSSGGARGGTGAPVDLNRATVDELDKLPGVGPSTAAAIVAHRDQHGPFRSVDDLLQVRGIGPAKLEGLRGQVRV